MSINSNPDIKDRTEESYPTYTAERHRDNYDSWWELLYAGTDKEKAIEFAEEHAREYYGAEARICTWLNGEIINTESITKRDE